MHIAVDARELEDRPTGVGRVLSGLLRAWPDGDELLLVTRRATGGAPGLDLDVVVAPGPRSLPGFGWEQLVLPRTLRRQRPDALLAPAYGMPLACPCPAIVGMHDCAFAAVPETFGRRERWRRRLAARIAARRAALLFTGSEFGAAEMRRHLGVSDERIAVLPYGVDERFRPAPDAEVAAIRRRYGLRGPTVLFVGSALGRRDLGGLDRVVAGLADNRPGLELGVVGIPPEPAPPLRAGRWLGYVPDDDLPALYSAAAVVAYPSRYEGFGLPVLEALACDTPVVAADVAALGEIFAGRATLVAADDPAAWGRALGHWLDRRGDDSRAAGAGAWARSRDWATAAVRLRRLVADRVREAP